MIIYTAIIGDYDTLLEPIMPGKYVAFVDREMDVPGWEIRKVDVVGDDPVRTARRFKCLSHWYFADQDATIWIDGKVQLAVPPEVLVKEWLADADLAVFDHPARFCLYDEAKQCVHWKIGDADRIKKQVLRYDKEGFPIDQGLAETRVVVRRNTPEITRFNEIWWTEVKRGSTRDQISFPYAAWRAGVRYAAAPMMVGWAHPWFSFQQHKEDKRVRFSLPLDRAALDARLKEGGDA